MSLRFVTGKVVGALLTLLFVLVANFFLFRVVEDNPVESLYRGRNLSPTQIASLEERFGVNDPLVVQFGKYLRQTAQGDLGISIKSSRPVSEEIADSFWPTVWLVGVGTAVATVVGIWTGIVAGWRRNSAFDNASTLGSMFTYSMPDFWIGMLLLAVFAVRLDLFPTGGFQDPGSTAGGLSAFADQAHHMVLPALTLALAYIGEYHMVMRASILDTVREDYLTLARAKGLRDILVRRHHAVPNALLPVVSLAALNFGYVLSGAIAVESIYSWPGLGQETFNAIQGPDFPMLQGLFLLFSAGVILANLAADLLYGYLDPRVRRGMSAANRRNDGVWTQFRRSRQAMAGLVILVGFVVLAFIAPVLADRDALAAVNTGDNPVWARPGGDFLLGTDNLGRSVAAQFVWGSRISLFVGLAATVLTIVLGSVIGICAGYFGRFTDAVLMRLTDWFLVIPFLPLAIVLAAVLGRSVWNIVLVIGVTSWPSTARLVRAQVLSVRRRLFVDRAVSLGAGHGYIIGRHILPNVAPLILANTTLAVPIAILTETTLSFLGLGDPRETSWGRTLEQAFKAGAISRDAWWYYLPAGIGIVAVVLAFTMCGRALEAILDPRLEGDR